MNNLSVAGLTISNCSAYTPNFVWVNGPLIPCAPSNSVTMSQNVQLYFRSDAEFGIRVNGGAIIYASFDGSFSMVITIAVTSGNTVQLIPTSSSGCMPVSVHKDDASGDLLQTVACSCLAA